VTSVLAERRDSAFERLYRRHLGDVNRYALAVMHNAADAEDVTQTTFMNAYRAFLKGERPRAPLNWLIAIAHNVCRERMRQSSRRPAEVELDESVREAIADEAAWTADEIREALSHLAFSQRTALVLRELQGRSYAEIAELLGLSIPAVEALVFRARRALREQLEGTFSCSEAEAAITRQLRGRASRAEKSALRAHLRECQACAGLARQRRGRRRALGPLGALPFPLPWKALFGAGGAASAGSSAGGGLAAKAAAVALAGVVVGGAGYEGVREVRGHANAPVVAAAPVSRSHGAATDAAAATRPVARGGVRTSDVPSAVRPGPRRALHGPSPAAAASVPVARQVDVAEPAAALEPVADATPNQGRKSEAVPTRAHGNGNANGGGKPARAGKAKAKANGHSAANGGEAAPRGHGNANGATRAHGRANAALQAKPRPVEPRGKSGKPDAEQPRVEAADAVEPGAPQERRPKPKPPAEPSRGTAADR
jgi:RNA polymerase sigma factor (sigma-70 family)